MAVQRDYWRNIAITLTDPYCGEQTAQAGENACFRQLTNCFGPGRPCELRGTRSRFNRTIVLSNCNGTIEQ